MMSKYNVKIVEPIDEEELDRFALEDIPNYCCVPCDEYLKNTWIEGFKTCYHKTIG